MVTVEYRLKLGQDEFTIKADVKDELEFFQRMSFYSNLPKSGPNGETDLKITHRSTKDGHNYYSIVSESAGQEFKFGQLKPGSGGGLFEKGWAPLYKAGQEDNDQEQAFPSSGAQAPLIGQVAKPTGFQMPTPTAPPVAKAQAVPPVVVAKPAPTPIPTVTTPVPAATQKTATDVLARFGIKQQ